MSIVPPELGEREVHLWIFESSILAPCIDGLHGHLQPLEQEEAQRYMTTREQQRFSLYRGAFRRVLSWYEGCRPDHIVLQRGRHGKPAHHVLNGEKPHATKCAEETHASDLTFNMSHSHDFGLFAVGRGLDVGVDVERIRLPRGLSLLMDHFFLPDESSVVNGAPDSAKAELFCRIWTRKEAAVKCFGGSLAEWIGILPVAENSFDLTIRHSGLSELHFQELHVGEGYLGCLCTSRPTMNVKLFQLKCDGWSLRSV